MMIVIFLNDDDGMLVKQANPVSPVRFVYDQLANAEQIFTAPAQISYAQSPIEVTFFFLLINYDRY